MEKSRRKLLWAIFFCTLKIGAFTFGGGYAMIPIMKEEFVNRRQWVSETDILDIFAIAQSVPGVISLNASTFIGYRLSGVAGAVMAALGVTLPSFFVIALISGVYLQFRDNAVVNAVLSGVRACVVGLMLSAVFAMGKAGVKNVFGWVMALAGFALTVFLPVHTAFIVIGAGLLGYIVYVIKKHAKPGDTQ